MICKNKKKKLKTLVVHQRFWFIYKIKLSYCLKCREKNSKNPKVAKTNKGKLIILSKCAKSNIKITRLIQVFISINSYLKCI